ncbi:MAG: dihydrodipicolinate reductase C-terminal domain-containing protein [Balneolaceae bacterium]|nr:dihydrodipicolinate reductase C-terminal domain-containing protein [Balneolaceae bacterium]
MKIAVIGTGKTGGKVIELLPADRISHTFDEDSPPSVSKLKEADVAIIFVPGSAVDDVFDIVLEARIPAVWGSTGYEWPEDLDTILKQAGVKWLKASNFSLGMNIIRRAIKVISQGSEMLNDPEFAIHEIHHIHKKDAPSGTALSWREWLGKEAEITSERKGDIKGIHELTVSTEAESIFLKHQAHDRAVFAQGAIWAAEQVLKEEVAPGFHDFSTIFDKAIGNR